MTVTSGPLAFQALSVPTAPLRRHGSPAVQWGGVYALTSAARKCGWGLSSPIAAKFCAPMALRKALGEAVMTACGKGLTRPRCCDIQFVCASACSAFGSIEAAANKLLPSPNSASRPLDDQ
jgi:hypothetical protein